MSSNNLRMTESAKPGDELSHAELQKFSSIDNELLRGVRVTLDARLGRTSMTVETMMALKTGSVVTLDVSLADHAELYLNGTLVARGEIVAVGDKFGVRIAEIAPK